MDREDQDSVTPCVDHTHEKGFTMVEVLVAIIILSIGLLALAGLQATVIKGNVASKNLTSAVFLVETKIDELKSGGYASLSDGTFNDPNNPVNEKGDSGGIFNRSWTISTYETNMRKIIVTVTWTDQVGGNRSTSLVTVLSDRMD